MQTGRARSTRFEPGGRIVRLPTPTGFPVGDIDSYVLLPETPDAGVVLVDTGVHTAAAWDALGAGLAELGRRVEDVRLVLLTHAHPDHFGQAARIVRHAGCPVWAHRDTPAAIAHYARPTPPDRLEVVRAFLRRLGVPGPRAEEAFGPPGGREIVEDVVVDRLLDHGDRLDLAEALPGFDGGFVLDVVHTPGHCADLVCYWHADSGSILAGDHLLPDITPVCLLDVPETPDGERRSTLAQFHASIDRVEPLPVRQLLPSHGDVLPSHRRLISDYRLHTRQRMLKMARMLARNEATPYDLGRSMFPKVYDAQLHLVLSEVMGHLDLLESEGHVACELRDGAVRYRVLSLPDPG